MSLSLMRRGYIKSTHRDRRDHLIHALFYIISESTKGGDIQIIKLKKKQIKTKLKDLFEWTMLENVELLKYMKANY